MTITKRIKGALSRYFERLGRENRALFGSGRPDCCTLNRRQQPRESPERRQEPRLHSTSITQKTRS